MKPSTALLLLAVALTWSTVATAQTYEETLAAEICDDPIGRGYTTTLKDPDLGIWTTNVIADLTEIRDAQTIPRASMSGGQILDSLDATELDALADSDFGKVLQLLSVASEVDPYGPVGDILFAKFPDGGASEIGFGAARQEKVPRWRKIGLSNAPNASTVNNTWDAFCPEVKQ